jgi:hypothetical protein
MRAPKFSWEKQSWLRYSARLGHLHVEVRKAPGGGWRVGEIFGCHHHTSSRKVHQFLEGAQYEAELTAIRLLAETRQAIHELESA